MPYLGLNADPLGFLPGRAGQALAVFGRNPLVLQYYVPRRIPDSSIRYSLLCFCMHFCISNRYPYTDITYSEETPRITCFSYEPSLCQAPGPA